jgi:tetratricopeptide (TPR) repeat protein
VQPANANVSTDLGTALFYSGRPDEALAAYEASLKADPSHVQTLFNIGVVRLEGKKDPKGAIDAWERLIAISPSSPDAAKARARLEDARRQLVGFAPIPLQSSR